MQIKNQFFLDRLFNFLLALSLSIWQVGEKISPIWDTTIPHKLGRFTIQRDAKGNLKSAGTNVAW